jgi:AraC-like DNA-binding protein
MTDSAQRSIESQLAGGAGEDGSEDWTDAVAAEASDDTGPRDILSIHLARFFAAGGDAAASRPARADAALDRERGMTPHSAGPRSRPALPPFVAPGPETGAQATSALEVPDHMQGEVVRALGLALLAEMGTDGPFSRHAVAMLAEALAAGLDGAVTEPPLPRRVARGGLAPHVLRRVTERMAVDLAEELDLPTLAAEARLSPWHFARAFKQSTGEPPHAYRTRMRIEHAKAMLMEGDEPVTAIAEAVGYDSAQSLARAFRKLTGRSPSVFRREARV